jgi:hypothetical protein
MQSRLQQSTVSVQGWPTGSQIVSGLQTWSWQRCSAQQSWSPPHGAPIGSQLPGASLTSKLERAPHAAKSTTQRAVSSRHAKRSDARRPIATMLLAADRIV